MKKYDDKIKIEELHPHALAQTLLHQHNGGSGFRDESDINNDKFHVRVTLETIKDLLENANWTKEELLKYVNSNIEGIELFKAKK